MLKEWFLIMAMAGDGGDGEIKVIQQFATELECRAAADEIQRVSFVAKFLCAANRLRIPVPIPAPCAQ